MINVPKYNKENRRQSFETLPKGAYVCKVMNLEEVTYKNGKRGIKISFDIAEGEYKDFYAEQYRKSTSEDKHWSMMLCITSAFHLTDAKLTFRQIGIPSGQILKTVIMASFSMGTRRRLRARCLAEYSA